MKKLFNKIINFFTKKKPEIENETEKFTSYNEDFHTRTIVQQVIVTNTTNKELNFVLFGENKFGDAVNYGSDIGIEITTPCKDVSYRHMLKQSAFRPFTTHKIRVLSSNYTQVKLPINYEVINAEGNSLHTPITVAKYYSEDQHQKGIIDIIEPHMIDDNTFFTGKILSNTTARYSFFLSEKIDLSKISINVKH